LIAGVAGQATTQVGNLVSIQSILTSVSQLNPIKVYFSISDSEYLALAKQAGTAGSDLLRGASKIPPTLTLSDGEVDPQEGHVVFVDRQLNSQTGAIRIAAAFPNPGNILRPGQFGRVTAATGMRHSAILVPQAALNEFQGREQVYTVAANNTAHVNNVTLGPRSGNNWIVEGGLSSGSLIITDNVQKARHSRQQGGAPFSAPEFRHSQNVILKLGKGCILTFPGIPDPRCLRVGELNHPPVVNHLANEVSTHRTERIFL
jgi:membrane fusion protein (multidrug efflux system)